MTSKSNTNTQITPKKGISASEKPSSVQFSISKQIQELATDVKKIHQSLEALKKGQAAQSQLLLKLSNKVKAPRQAKSTLLADEIVS